MGEVLDFMNEFDCFGLVAADTAEPDIMPVAKTARGSRATEKTKRATARPCASSENLDLPAIPGSPAKPNGPLLVAVPRRRGQELQLHLSDCHGKPFVQVRLWQKDRAGRYWPDKTKGLTFRPGELDAVIEALQKARSDIGSI